MRNRSKNAPNWNIWNPPCSKSINYSSIYDKRREFQRLIRKMKIEGPNTGEMSSCCIFDYTMSCASKNQKKIDAIVFDESRSFNCLLLRLVLDEQFLIRKSNSLMVFLNKSRNCKIFELHNSCLYVSCEEGFKWPVFYYLFEFLLQKPSKTIIGVKFYTHFVCKNLIVSELTFLLIHSPTHETPKLAVMYEGCQSEKVIDSKSAKISSKSDLEDLSSFKTNLPLEKKLCQEPSKNKHTVLKCCKCNEPKWQHFKPILKCARNDYKYILEAKGILLKSTLNYPLNSYSNAVYKTWEKVKPCENSTKTSGADSAKGSSLKRKLPEEYTEKDIECTKEKVKSPKLSNESRIEQVGQKIDKTLRNLSNYLNHDLKNGLKEIKSTSMVVLSEKNIPKMKETDEIPLKRKLSVGCTKETNSVILTKENYSINNKPGFGTNELKTDEVVVTNSFMNFKSAFSSISNILGDKLETSSKPSNNLSEIPTFQTASGKSLIISDKARRIAEKIYTEVCSQSTESDKQEEMKNISTINSMKEFNDDELDTFFKDVCDETDIQCSSFSTQGNITHQYQQGKSRKSLGGRRSLKPYSHKP